MSRRNASEYKQMDGAPAGPQPKKRRKPNANAANLNAGNNAPSKTIHFFRENLNRKLLFSKLFNKWF